MESITSVTEVEDKHVETGRRWPADRACLHEELAVVVVTERDLSAKKYLARVIDKSVPRSEIKGLVAMRKQVERLVQTGVVDREAYSYFPLPLLSKENRDLLEAEALYNRLEQYFDDHTAEAFATEEKARDARLQLCSVADKLEGLMPKCRKALYLEDKQDMERLLTSAEHDEATAIGKARRLLSSSFKDLLWGRHSCIFTSLLPWQWKNYTAPDLLTSPADAQALREVVERNRASFLEQMAASVWLMGTVGDHVDWHMRNVVVGAPPHGRDICFAIVDFAGFEIHSDEEAAWRLRDGAHVAPQIARTMLSEFHSFFRIVGGSGCICDDADVVEKRANVLHSLHAAQAARTPPAPALGSNAANASIRVAIEGGTRGGSRGTRGVSRGTRGVSRGTRGGSRGTRGGSRGTRGGSRAPASASNASCAAANAAQEAKQNEKALDRE